MPDKPTPPNGRSPTKRAGNSFVLKARQLGNAALAFDYRAYRSAGNAKLADVERLAGRRGWLTVSLLTLAPTDPKIGQRQRLLVSGFADDGNGLAAIDLDPKTVDDLFLVPATSRAVTDAVPIARLDAMHEIARVAALTAEQEASMNWLNEETEKLDAYADDLDTAANIQIKEKETIIKAAKKALRSNTEMSLDDKIKEQRRIKAMDREVDDLKMKTYERKKDIRAEADAKLDALANALKTVPVIEPVLTIWWEVKA